MVTMVTIYQKRIGNWLYDQLKIPFLIQEMLTEVTIYHSINGYNGYHLSKENYNWLYDQLKIPFLIQKMLTEVTIYHSINGSNCYM